MKRLILFIGLILPMLGLGQEKRKPTGVTLCFGVGPVYCYYGHNVWIITPGLLNDPDWDMRTMSVPYKKETSDIGKILPVSLDEKNNRLKRYIIVDSFTYNPKILWSLGR